MRKVFVFLLPPESSLTRDVEDVIDALWLQFFKCFISVTVNKWGTLHHPFAGV